MKKGTFLPAIAALILMAGIAICCPAEGTEGRKATPQIKTDANRPFEMPKDMIDKILADIKAKDPNKAKELEALRDKDPAKFREELRIDALRRRIDPENKRNLVWRRPGDTHFEIEWADANRLSEMPKDVIDRMLTDIKERDPNKGKELEALRDKDPAKFREELMGIFHERMEAMRDRGFGPDRMAGGPEGPKGMAGPPPGPGEQPPGFGPFQEKTGEFLKWVKDNYPEESKKLEDLKNDQGLYDRQLRLLGRKYGWLYERIRENPKLGEVLKEDMELAKERNSILKKIKEAKSNAEKEKLKAELEKVVSERYDLIVKRTQIEYEQLSNKLEELKKQVEESKANVKKWKDEEFKKEQVKKQVKRLLEQGDEPFPRWE
jgi:hypothetical protein